MQETGSPSPRDPRPFCTVPPASSAFMDKHLREREDPPAEQWREAAELVRAQWRDGDRVDSNHTNLWRHYLPQVAFINNRSFEVSKRRLSNERGNSYLAPNALLRQRPFGMLESFDCRPSGGEKPNARERFPPCFVQPPMLFDGNKYPRLQRGKAPVKPGPFTGNEGTAPAGP